MQNGWISMFTPESVHVFSVKYGRISYISCRSLARRRKPVVSHSKTHHPVAQRHHNPKWILISPAEQPFRVETCHSTSNIPYYARSLFTVIPKAISPVVNKWQKVRDTVSFLCLFQIHSRETLTKSISLPRSAYWQHITRQNSVGDLYSYQGTGMKSLIIIRTSLLFLYLHMSVVMCGALLDEVKERRVERQEDGDTGKRRNRHFTNLQRSLHLSLSGICKTKGLVVMGDRNYEIITFYFLIVSLYTKCVQYYIQSNEYRTNFHCHLTVTH